MYGACAMLRRSRLRRGPWRRKKNRGPRPGVTTKPPSGRAWKLLCTAIRARDEHRCRRCNTPVLGAAGQIDHIIPRRLCESPAVADSESNLVTLCAFCHSVKTQTIEPALYRADLLTFQRFLIAIGEPLPSMQMRTAAYIKITEAMRG